MLSNKRKSKAGKSDTRSNAPPHSQMLDAAQALKIYSLPLTKRSLHVALAVLSCKSILWRTTSTNNSNGCEWPGTATHVQNKSEDEKFFQVNQCDMLHQVKSYQYTISYF